VCARVRAERRQDRDVFLAAQMALADRNNAKRCVCREPHCSHVAHAMYFSLRRSRAHDGHGQQGARAAARNRRRPGGSWPREGHRCPCAHFRTASASPPAALSSIFLSPAQTHGRRTQKTAQQRRTSPHSGSGGSLQAAARPVGTRGGCPPGGDTRATHLSTRRGGGTTPSGEVRHARVCRPGGGARRRPHARDARSWARRQQVPCASRVHTMCVMPCAPLPAAFRV